MRILNSFTVNNSPGFGRVIGHGRDTIKKTGHGGIPQLLSLDKLSDSIDCDIVIFENSYIGGGQADIATIIPNMRKQPNKTPGENPVQYSRRKTEEYTIEHMTNPYEYPWSANMCIQKTGTENNRITGNQSLYAEILKKLLPMIAQKEMSEQSIKPIDRDILGWKEKGLDMQKQWTKWTDNAPKIYSRCAISEFFNPALQRKEGVFKKNPNPNVNMQTLNETFTQPALDRFVNRIVQNEKAIRYAAIKNNFKLEPEDHERDAVEKHLFGPLALKDLGPAAKIVPSINEPPKPFFRTAKRIEQSQTYYPDGILAASPNKRRKP